MTFFSKDYNFLPLPRPADVRSQITGAKRGNRSLDIRLKDKRVKPQCSSVVTLGHIKHRLLTAFYFKYFKSKELWDSKVRFPWSCFLRRKGKKHLNYFTSL